MPGRYRIFLGMAAGVGKTYRMLAEAQAEAEAGRDVVIGLLETHGRAETEALADGLEVVPRRRVAVPRRRRSRRWTCRAILAPRARAVPDRRARAHQRARRRAPEALRGHRRRAATAGIDVFSTVNVQHLESLNDQVAELTGVRVRETVPDDELERADEIVLDRPPARGPDRAPAATARSTRRRACRTRSTGSSGSRTCARCARSRCARWPRPSRRGASRSSRSPSACWRFVGPRRARRAGRAPRRALRAAARRRARRAGGGGRASRRRSSAERLEELRRLTAMLGAHLLVEEGDELDGPASASPASAARPTSCSARRRGWRLRRAAAAEDPARAARRRRPGRRRPSRAGVARPRAGSGARVASEAMPEVRELREGESRRAAAALLELRPHVGSPAAMTERIDAQRPGGYRVVAAFDDGEEDAAAVAGFRIAENLAWGRFLYVDDLITRASHRGRGHADAVMAWVVRGGGARRLCRAAPRLGRRPRPPGRAPLLLPPPAADHLVPLRSGTWRDRGRAPAPRREREGPRGHALRGRHGRPGAAARAAGAGRRGARAPARHRYRRRARGAGRRGRADRGRPAAGGRHRPRGRAAGPRGDRVVGPARRIGDRRDRSRRRGRRRAGHGRRRAAARGARPRGRDGVRRRAVAGDERRGRR